MRKPQLTLVSVVAFAAMITWGLEVAFGSDGEVLRDDCSLHYKIVGDTGPYAVILSGGPGDDVRYMQPVADELGKRFQCIMLEQRGTGRSVLKRHDATTLSWSAYIEDIEALRKHVKIEKLTLVGNSWGMMLAFSYGGKYPKHVSRIITLGSGPITDAYGGVFEDNTVSRLQPSEREARRYWQDEARQAEDPQRAAYEVLRAEMPAYYFRRDKALEAAMDLRPSDLNPHVFPAIFGGEAGFDIRPELKKILAPVLLVQGRQDVAGGANIYEAHQLISNSVLKFVEQSGHMPWEEQPDQVWTIVREFLDSQ